MSYKQNFVLILILVGNIGCIQAAKPAGIATIGLTVKNNKNQLLPCNNKKLANCSILVTQNNAICQLQAGSITITNNSRIVAKSIRAFSSNANFISYIVQSNNCPVDLSPGASCTISFVTNVPSTFQVPNVSVSGSNTTTTFFDLNAYECGEALIPVVGKSLNPNFSASIPLSYTSADNGLNWLLNPTFVQPTGKQYGELNAVSCVNNNCISIGSAGSQLTDTTSQGYLPTPLAYTSSNYGSNWTLLGDFTLPAPQTIGVLSAISCSQANCITVGYVATTNNFGDVQNRQPVAYRSTNMGANWTLSPAFTIPNGQSQGELLAVSCTTLYCIASGSYFSNSGAVPLVYITSDNGLNWITSSDIPLPLNATFAQFTSTYCDDNSCISGGFSGSGFFVDNFPVIYRSTDNGSNWMQSSGVMLPPGQAQGSINGVTCTGSICIAVGNSSDSSFNSFPLAYRSIDNGLTWTYFNNFVLPPGQSEVLLNDISCKNTLCIAVGVDRNTNNPIIYNSNDTGLTWSLSSNLDLPQNSTGAILRGVSK